MRSASLILPDASVERGEVKHTRRRLQAFMDALLQRAQGDPARIAIGIEVPRGALVELCVERGFNVYAINPKQVDRFRDRFTVAGAKDDPRDAHVIGDALRTDPHAFRRVRLDHPLVIQMREWSRVDDDLREELSRLTNQLRDLSIAARRGCWRCVQRPTNPGSGRCWRPRRRPPTQQRLSERRLNGCCGIIGSAACRLPELHEVLAAARRSTRRRGRGRRRRPHGAGAPAPRAGGPATTRDRTTAGAFAGRARGRAAAAGRPARAF